MAFVTTVMGWNSANTWSHSGMVSVGTKTELANTSGNVGRKVAAASGPTERESGAEVELQVIGRAGMDFYPDPPGTPIETAAACVTGLGGSSANIAVAILALVVLFGGKDLGAATVAVTVTAGTS